MKFKLITLLLALFYFGTLTGYCFAKESESMTKALQTYYSKDFASASDMFLNILESEPRNSMAVMYLCDCYRQQKKVSELLTSLEEKSLANPKSSDIKSYLGFAYFTQSIVKKDDTFEEASNMLSEALKLDEGNPLAYTGMGTVYYQKRLIPRAKSYFTKAISINPDDSMALERLGDIYMNDDKSFVKARDTFKIITELYPTYPDAYFYYGSASQKMGENDMAIEYFKKSAALDPLGITLGYYSPVRIGDIYYEAKNLTKAEEAYNDALKINPENSYAKKMIDKIKNPQQSETEDKNSEVKKDDKNKDKKK